MSDKQSPGLFSFNFAALVAFVLSLFGIDSLPGRKVLSEAPVVLAAIGQAEEKQSQTGEPATVLPTLANVRTEIAGPWADPFKGRKRELTPCPDPGVSGGAGDNPYSDLQNYLFSRSGTQSLTVLPIQLDSGNLPSQQETRLNTRHAVEYALATAGYEMDFEDRMSYVSPCWQIWFGGKFRFYRAEIPIKLYSRRPGSMGAKKDRMPTADTQHLLVCWIDHQLLGSKRIQTLVTMLQTLLGDDLLKRSRVRFIGPIYSSEVDQVQQECTDWESQTDPPEVWNSSSLASACSDFQAIAPSATSPATSTIALSRTPDSQDQMSGFRLTCPMVDDSHLAANLVRELMIRRRQYGQILIVRETGSGSPDQLSQSIACALKKLPGFQQTSQQTTLTYLRNIAFGENGAAISRDNRSLDDYFQRQLANLTQNKSFSGDDVSAVFVIGNDTQDKLTVLKNLKPLFPNATFFTHDLHYSFYSQENLPFTRGLVVGSRGTLSASDEQQQPGNAASQPGIVFRDCYQKATFTAVCSAVSADARGQVETQPEITLFEISRNGPVLLRQTPPFLRLLKLSGIPLGLLLLLTLIYHTQTATWLTTHWQAGCQATIVVWRWLRLRYKRLLPSTTQQGSEGKPEHHAAGTAAAVRTAPALTHLFEFLQKFTPETGFSAIVAMLLWRCHWYGGQFRWMLLFLSYTFLTVFMVLWPLLPAPRPDSRLQQFNARFQFSRRIILELWTAASVLICCTFLVLDYCNGIHPLNEPYDITSGISSWPVLLGMIAVVITLAAWLRQTWQVSIDRHQSTDAKQQISWLFPSVIDFPEPLTLQQLPALLADRQQRIHDRDAQQSIHSNTDHLIVSARIATAALLVVFISLQAHQATTWIVNWGLLPLPPARASIVQAGVLLFGTLGLLLTLHSCISGLIQVRLLLVLINSMNKRLDEIPNPLTVGSPHEQAAACRRCFEACNFIQHSTQLVIRHSLRDPAALLLGYAACRLPLLESWAASANSILLIAGIPTAIALLLALQLRFSSNRFRQRTLQSLNLADLPPVAPPANDPDDRALPDWVRRAIQDSRSRIAALSQGAFSNIWQDPILGTAFFLATALGSSQSFNPITFLLGFIPG